MQLLEAIEDRAHQIEHPRAVDVARELHDLPRIARGQLCGVAHQRRALRLRQALHPRGAVLAAHRLGLRVEFEQVADRAPQALARFDQIEHPVLEQEAGGLEPLGQLLADRLLDHRRSREADMRVGLGDQDVAQRRVGGAHAAVGGIGEQRDVQHALLSQSRDRLAGLDHLHQRHAALLHTRAAGGRDHQQGRTGLQCYLRGARDRLAHRAAHAAADEGEVDARHHDRQTVDRASAVQRARLRLALLLRGRDPLGVGLGVHEGERVHDLQIPAQLLEAALIEQLAEALADAQAEVVVAVRAHAEVAAQALVVHERRAGGAAKPLRGDRAAGCGELSQGDLPRPNGGRRRACAGTLPAKRSGRHRPPRGRGPARPVRRVPPAGRRSG